MQGIENITARIEADARAEIDRIQADAQAQADRITAGYAARADREVADILEKGKRAAEERAGRLVSAAQMEARKMTLGAKQEVLDEAFELALSKLCALSDGAYTALLADLAVAAGNGTEELIFNAADRAKVGAQVVALANEKAAKAGKAAKFTLSDQTRPIRGGVLISDGAVEVNCALETLVRLSRSEVTGEVGKLLFS